MGDKHADERDRKARKRRFGMQMSGRSIKTVLLPLISKNSTPKKKGRKK